MLTVTATVGGWFFRKVIFEAILRAVHGPVFAKLDELFSNFKEDSEKRQEEVNKRLDNIDKQIDHLRTNGAAFSDRVANIEQRLNQGARELDNLRQDVFATRRTS